jgi:hypothetical protein
MRSVPGHYLSGLPLPAPNTHGRLRPFGHAAVIIETKAAALLVYEPDEEQERLDREAVS